MQSQIQQKPIFIPIINHSWTPNHNSILIVKKWFDELYGPSVCKLLETSQINSLQFEEYIKGLTEGRETVCFYICLHGKQYINKETGKPEEFLLLNSSFKIKDEELTRIINDIKFKNLYIYIESCHGGGLLNMIKIDDKSKSMANVSVVIFNVCSKEQKCYVQINGGQTIGLVTGILNKYQMNPFRTPEKGLELIKRIYPTLDSKVTIMKNLS